MGEKVTKFKLKALERCGSLKALHGRLEENGKSIKLQRLYLISGGFVQPSAVEKATLARFLQTPVSELFREYKGGAK